MELSDLIYSLRDPSKEKANKKFEELYNGRNKILERLETLNKRIDKELKKGAKINKIINDLVR